MYNREFETIDNEDKAYVLGLWYADGNIHKDIISIVLHKNDLKLFEKIKSIFPFFNLNKKGENAYVLTKHNKLLAQDFRNLGACPKKSYDNKEEFGIPDIPLKLLHHFIRGFFDGDGSVFIQKINNIKVEMGGAGFRFISELLKILYDLEINFYMNCRFPNENNVRKQNFYRIYTSSYVESKKFAEYIYKDVTICMDRKKDLLEQELIARNSKIRIQCPTCFGYKTVYNGFRNNKIRIYCKSCQKNYTTAPVSSNINSGMDELLES